MKFRLRMLAFLVLPAFLVLLFIDDIDSQQIAAASFSIIGFALTYHFSAKSITRQGDQKETQGTPHITFFFGLLFIVVAALAITEGLSRFNESTLNTILLGELSNVDIFNSLALLTGFFAVAVLFFHGGITFLATPAADALTKDKEVAVLGNFIVLFIEAIIIFFMGANVNSISDLLILLAALMIVDISCVLIYTQAFPDLVFIEWFYLDLFTLIFVLICLSTSISWVTPALFMLITLSRTITDYRILWRRFYGKYPLTEL